MSHYEFSLIHHYPVIERLTTCISGKTNKAFLFKTVVVLHILKLFFAQTFKMYCSVFID
jgi:hypothetical protein